MDLIIGQKPEGQKPGPATSAPAQPDAMIVDGDQSTFMTDVVEASRTIPVLVDFWATWCGPCKTLTPALEKVTRAAGGRVKLVKIDIDKNASLVQQLVRLGLPLQSVPTVAAFWQGQIADLFQGAQPESEIKRFVEALLKTAGGSMPGADLVAEAKAALDAGNPQGAGELYSAALEQEPENPEAWGGLIRALTALGDEDQAQEALAQVPARIAEHAEVSGARSALALAAEGRQARDQLATFEARLAADAADHQARYDLATALNAMDRREEAAEALLEIVRRNRTWNDGAARLQLLKFFEAWGFDDEATMAARRKLSALLFELMALPEPRLEDLPGEFPVFPLAGALLLPHGKLPLNIFEPRYCALTEDALAAGRLFGMIQPEADKPAGPCGPALYRVGCLGRLASFSETDDGRYLITLAGVVRFRTAAELQMRRGYRRVRADFSPFAADLAPPDAGCGCDRAALLAALRGYFAHRGFDANWDAINEMQDDALVTTLCMVCPFDAAEKQALLEARLPADRAQALLTLLQIDTHEAADDTTRGRFRAS